MIKAVEGSNRSSGTPLPHWIVSPKDHRPLNWHEGVFQDDRGATIFLVGADGVLRLASPEFSPAAEAQRCLYDRVGYDYVENVGLRHTRAYLEDMRRSFELLIGGFRLGRCAELCCGSGDGLADHASRIENGVGLDVSTKMLAAAAARLGTETVTLIQGDTTVLPFAADSLDSVLVLGGIHHVKDLSAFFSEVVRVLRPGGRLFFREPLDDFPLWRAIRKLVYRWSSSLDHETEAPLRYQTFAAACSKAGMTTKVWQPFGLFA